MKSDKQYFPTEEIKNHYCTYCKKKKTLKEMFSRNIVTLEGGCWQCSLKMNDSFEGPGR